MDAATYNREAAAVMAEFPAVLLIGPVERERGIAMEITVRVRHPVSGVPVVSTKTVVTAEDLARVRQVLATLAPAPRG